MQPLIISFCLALGAALLAGLVATPMVRGFARRIGFIDKPDGSRKHQKDAVALGGGVAVYIALMFGILVSFAYADWHDIDLLNTFNMRIDLKVYRALLVASAWILILGLIDDRFGMRGRYKLLGQLIAAGIMVYSGVVIDRFSLFGHSVVIVPWLSLPLSILWLIVTINAINLIDGIDGLASSVGTVLCLTVGAICGLMGHYSEGLIVVALAGGLLGFLRYNMAPASIYLGDTGSMLIGLIVGVIATHTSVKSPAAIAMAVPLAVWSVPILDSTAAILRRKLTGRSLFAPDRGHLHHSLLIRGWSVRQATMFVTLIAATTCLSAVLSILWKKDWIALAIIVAVVAYLISTKTFGHIEFALLKHRFRSDEEHPDDEATARRGSVRLQGSRQWDKLWLAMVESAGDQRLQRMRLSINIPSLHEVFYATWKSRTADPANAEMVWTVSHPLIVDGQKVGELALEGLPDDAGGSTLSQVVQVLDFLEPIEEDVRRIREQLQLDHAEAEGRPSLLATEGRTPIGSETPGESAADPAEPSPSLTGPST